MTRWICAFQCRPTIWLQLRQGLPLELLDASTGKQPPRAASALFRLKLILMPKPFWWRFGNEDGKLRDGQLCVPALSGTKNWH